MDSPLDRVQGRSLLQVMFLLVTFPAKFSSLKHHFPAGTPSSSVSSASGPTLRLWTRSWCWAEKRGNRKRVLNVNTAKDNSYSNHLFFKETTCLRRFRRSFSCPSVGPEDRPPPPPIRTETEAAAATTTTTTTTFRAAATASATG